MTTTEEYTLLERITEKFGRDGLHWSCLQMDGERILTEMVKQHPDAGKRPLNIVEIGTHYGVSACILSRWGDVETFDIEHFEQMKTVIESFQGQYGIVEYVEADPDVLREIIKGRIQYADIAFVDGGHTYADIAADFNAVKSCGHVIFHDYTVAAHYPGVVKFIDELAEKNPSEVLRVEPFALWSDGEPHVASKYLWGKSIEKGAE